MRTIQVETEIAARRERCFNLALDLVEHAQSAAATGERVVETTAKGRLGLNDTVTFEATHFGLRWRMTARVTLLEENLRFVDEQVRGPFRSFRHEHIFEPVDAGTRMVDVFTFAAPFPRLTEPLLERHLERFLRHRAAHLRRQAESEEAHLSRLSMGLRDR